MAAGIITDTGDLFSLENLYNAYKACRRRKRQTCNCLRFEARLLSLLDLIPPHKSLFKVPKSKGLPSAT